MNTQPKENRSILTLSVPQSVAKACLPSFLLSDTLTQGKIVHYCFTSHAHFVCIALLGLRMGHHTRQPLEMKTSGDSSVVIVKGSQNMPCRCRLSRPTPDFSTTYTTVRVQHTVGTARFCLYCSTVKLTAVSHRSILCTVLNSSWMPTLCPGASS